MRDSCRAQTPSPSHFLSQDCERAASHDFGSGGGDPTARLNSNTPHLRQRSHHHHHQVPWRESHSTSALEGNGNGNGNGRGSVGCCAVSTWANALPNAGGVVGMIVNTSQLRSPSLCAAAAVNPPSGRSTSSSTRYRQREAAGCPTSEAASTAPDATVAFAPSASGVASGVAVSRTQCSDHNSTRAAERVAKVSLRGASGAAATPEHHCTLREPAEHPQESSSTSLRLYASASTAPSTATRGNLADPKRHGRLLPPSIMSEVARASGRRSCSCPNIRSTTAIGAAIVSIPLAICTSAAASTRAASAVTHPARILGSTGSLPRPTNMQPQKFMPPTAPDFKPLGLWNTSAASAAAASTLEDTLELEASAATTSSVDIGSLLTYETDGGVVIMDPIQTPADLICGVCMCACRHPTTTACGHLFCRRCLQTWIRENQFATCPLDRNPIQVQLLRADARAQRQINMLPCRCPASLPRALQLELRHLGSQSYVQSDRTTEDEGEADDVMVHGQARRDHPRCTWVGCVSDAAAHLRQCPYIIIECPFAKHGCSAEMPRADMAKHLKNGVADHLLLVSKALDESTEQCRVLQGEVEVLRRRCPMHYPVALLNVPTGEPAGNSDLMVSMYSSSLHGIDVATAAVTPGHVIPGGGGGSGGGAAPIALTGLAGGGVSPDSVSSTRVVGTLAHGASAAAVEYLHPAFSRSQPPYPHSHRGLSSTAAHTNLRQHAATDNMMLAAAHRVPIGRDATIPMPTDTTALCNSSLPHIGAPPVSFPVANTAATAPTFDTPAGAAALIPARVAGASPFAVAVVGSGRGVDRFMWVITDMVSRQAPCYSRPFTSHGLPWYVGIDTTDAWEKCGVYLFTEGHNSRVDFRVILYHEDPARDVVHVVQDWQEDYIGKGWGPLRFIDRFMLEQDGFLVNGCLRVGIEVLSEPY